MDSILNTVKKALGIDVDYLAYDTDLIAKINVVLATLHDLGAGPVELFAITGDTETWTDFLGDSPRLDDMKVYISDQVRKVFDPLSSETQSEDPNSILINVKKMLGIGTTDDAFDTDVITNINSVFMVLNQLGVGTTDCFSVRSTTETWSDFLGDAINFEAVKTYIYLKVRMLFDPPTSSAVADAMNRQIGELEFRLLVQAEPIPEVITISEGDDEDEEFT